MENKDNKIIKIRHSLSHLMSMAVLELYPEAGLGVGPTIENGFYQDYDFSESINEDVLLKLEKRMKHLIKQNIKFEKREMSFADALEFYKNDPYKTELINDLKDAGEKSVSFYKSDWYNNLCNGPHVESTTEINPNAFKLTKLAGAYWRGDEKNKMLTRIYGIAFETEQELKEYEEKITEAIKRDHRKLGKELDLFSFHEDYGPGLVYWHPKGARIRTIMEDFWRKEHYKNGYDLIYTPHIGKADLWQTSGHLDFYADSMYNPMTVDEEKYYIKPMNCPFHIQIYKNSIHSYRNLPLRWAELGTVYRYEMAGALHGLLRVRGFTQDDAHLICTPEQMPAEIKKVIEFSLFMLKSFGFEDFTLYLSTQPNKSVGDDKLWENATKALGDALKELNIEYKTDEGGGAFYGPKIDIKIKDALDREWQCSTIQFDFNLPERFEMEYIDASGQPQRPYMIHRALMGSIERFFGTMIEHFAGAFPFWLSPVQIRILPVGENHIEYSKKIAQQFRDRDFRVEIDNSDNTVGKKIREAEMQKIPFIIVLGDKEIESQKLAVRERGQRDIAEMSFDEFVEKCEKLLVN